MQKKILYILVLLACQSCFLFPDSGPGPKKPIEENPLPEFNTATSYLIQAHLIDEASGIVASQSIPNSLWVIEDGDNPSALHLLSKQGIYQGRLELPIQNRDWEDLAAGPGPIAGQNYIYIGDTGDNLEHYGTYTMYRIPEPSSLSETDIKIDAIRFRYDMDEAGLDVEAFFVEPKTKDIYFISKLQFFSVKVYRLTYPYSLEDENVAEFLGTIPHSAITAADISTDGTQLMIKNYSAIFYWRLKENETIFEALSRSRDVGVPYYVEPQGEALCFDEDNLGYFTLSELNGETPVNLNYYSRKVVEQ